MAIQRSVASVSVAAFMLVVPVLAHVDDPKERDKQKPYVGPGYMSAAGGIAGVPIEFPSSNVQLLAWIPVGDFNPGNTSCATVEGYVSPSGREYAVIGMSDGTGFVEVTNPGKPVILNFLTGPESLWKDVRVYQDRAYSVSEGGMGIQVFNMSQIDDGVVTHVGNFNTPTGTSANTHTMFINQASGRLYRAGGSSNGLRIYDISANPDNPVFLGTWPDRYVHEVTVVSYTEGPYAGKEIAFCCGGFNGGQVETGLYIVDVTNLLDGNPNNGNPLLSYTTYPGASFSHQGWLSEDKQLFYLDDELDEPEITSLTRIINISNLSAPFHAGDFTSGAGSVDHNLYVKGNLIFESNYRSGLRVFDATNPTDPKEIAFFDTYPQDDAPNFNSLWDNYPYLPSGIVLGSDIEKGFFIWHVGEPVLAIDYPNGQPAMIDPAGDELSVSIVAIGDDELQPGTAKLNTNSGAGWVVTDLQSLGKGLFNATFPAAQCGATVQWYVSAQTKGGITVNSPQAAPNETFSATAAISESSGFTDTLEAASPWVVGAGGDNATSGVWVRVDPLGTGAQPENDNTAAGTMCWVTGQGTPGGAIGEADVDGGTTTLTSQTFDATLDSPAYIEYYRWYSNNLGADPNNDSMPIQISNNNGSSWVQLELVTENQGLWVRKQFRISDFVAPTTTMKLRFIARDLNSGSVVEAGVDDLRVVYYECEPTDLPGDVTGNGIVDVDDLLAVINAWGACAGCAADLTGNGVVDVDDLLEVINNWG
jgi:choice-of-anchor B domain-containing protein